jgi:hypothetical protein
MDNGTPDLFGRGARAFLPQQCANYIARIYADKNV